jgi:heme/copper-type cytochrome/quinol oxidase subunit 2
MEFKGTPNLIDLTAGNHMLHSLRQCHETRVATYSFLFNAVIVAVFIFVTIVILYLCYTYKRKNKIQQIPISSRGMFEPLDV